jgi:hypothetical protein
LNEQEAPVFQLYKKFYRNCREKLPAKLYGSDLFEVKDFKTWAEELLESDKVENFLDEKDYVFMFHQGYIFWFFKAEGTTDPMFLDTVSPTRRKENLKKFLSL